MTHPFEIELETILPASPEQVWEDEYDALRRGWPFHLNTLREYLAHFPGRTRVPVFAMAAPDGRSAQEVRAALTRGLSLLAPVVVGTRAHTEPADPRGHIKNRHETPRKSRCAL